MTDQELPFSNEARRLDEPDLCTDRRECSGNEALAVDQPPLGPLILERRASPSQDGS
jgi:hypothetical protein